LVDPGSSKIMEMFKDQIAVITGASNGIGRAIAIELASKGARCYLVARRKEKLEETVKLIGAAAVKPVVLDADLTSREDIDRVRSVIEKDGGKLDILVHSAGIYYSARTEEASADEFERLFHANVKGPFELTQSLLPALRNAKGQIIFINSSQGLNAGAGAGQFAATQHSMKAFADSLRAEVNEDGVRVTSLYLGRTATSRMESMYDKQGKKYQPELLIQPEDIAGVVSNAISLARTAEITDITIRPMIKSY
jgi:NADP-dependent 3-hydroxy acid dehydrogenase YdfG